MIFSSIRENFGGRVRVILTGSSLPNPDTIKFIKVCLGCEVLESYGVVESGYSNLLGSNSLGPLNGNQLKLVYNPAIVLEGLDNDKYGELHIKNEHFAASYLSDPIPNISC